MSRYKVPLEKRLAQNAQFHHNTPALNVCPNLSSWPNAATFAVKMHQDLQECPPFNSEIEVCQSLKHPTLASVYLCPHLGDCSGLIQRKMDLSKLTAVPQSAPKRHIGSCDADVLYTYIDSMGHGRSYDQLIEGWCFKIALKSII